ncbi:MAG: efflux RND transporter periplasmic adaptor subunit [Candidatus Gracilibacteria bacterium]|jgi:RND family efflux transporter MFP subunit
MKKIISIIVVIGLIVGGYAYRNEITLFLNKKVAQEVVKIPRELPIKEVGTFVAGTETQNLIIKKSGTVKADSIAYIVPETSGKVESINVKIGDNVKKGQTLISLGNSLSTDIAEIQLNQANKSLYLSEKSEEITYLMGENTTESAFIALTMAKSAYENSLQTKEDTEETFEYQLENIEISLDTAEKSYENSKKTYENTLDTLEDLQDKYDELSENLPEEDENLQALEAEISKLETQVDSLKFAKQASKNAFEQTKIGESQLEETIENQTSQLENASEMAYLQYLAAASQFENATAGAALQYYGVMGQELQAEGLYETSKLNYESRFISSPIDGTVTEIKAEENNFVSPGQIVIKVENLKSISIKTSINEKEALFINIGDKVKITSNLAESSGEISSISPSLNDTSKKIDVEISINSPENFIPGANVNIEISPSTKGKIFIPLNSIFLDEDKKFVKVIDKKDKVEIKEIVTGEIIENYIQVIKGLKYGEIIVSDQTIFVEEGDKVLAKK